jgi:hypothetical protein
VFTGWRRPSPSCACQGVEVGRGHPHEAALIEGVAGGRERGDDSERGPAQRGRSDGAAAGCGGPDGGHDHSGYRAVDSACAGPIGDSQAAVVEIQDEDVPPPGWDQWVNLPAPAPEPPTGVLVVRDDGGVAPG